MDLKNDIKLVIGFAAVGIVLVIAFLFMKEPGGQVVVSVEGEEYARYDLNEDMEVVISGKNGGKNVLVIENGKACIREADCPDKLCVKQGWTKDRGQSIICLPNEVVVAVESGEEPEIDGVVR